MELFLEICLWGTLSVIGIIKFIEKTEEINEESY